MFMKFQRAAASRPILANKMAVRQAVMWVHMNPPNYMIYAATNTNMADYLQVDGMVLYNYFIYILNIIFIPYDDMNIIHFTKDAF